MQQGKNQLQLSSSFIVRRNDINDNGILNVGKMLLEINRLYDQAIVLAFGDLNFYRVVTSLYNLEFTGHGHLGDQVHLDVDAEILFGSSLSIDILAATAETVIAAGRFVFELQPVQEEYAEACLN
jgi:hypothetical protein